MRECIVSDLDRSYTVLSLECCVMNVRNTSEVATTSSELRSMITILARGESHRTTWSDKRRGSVMLTSSLTTDYWKIMFLMSWDEEQELFVSIPIRQGQKTARISGGLCH